MRVHHQAGHNIVWNLDSLELDGAGDGIIFSPVNDTPERILGTLESIRNQSFFDPQFYIPASERGKLPDYPFFPSTAMGDFTTTDFQSECWNIARECVRWQLGGRFSHIVIPTRYHDDLPSDHFEHMTSCYVEPFTTAISELGCGGRTLLTVIAKQGQITDRQQRNFLLNWVTGQQNIDGVYLILEHNSQYKQIKDPMYLAGCLEFINVLKQNDLSVHLGYTNTEGLFLSIANPDSISMGSYENLRKFQPSRFEEQLPSTRRQPSPRLYSGALMQWIELTYVQAIQALYPRWAICFEDSDYTTTGFQAEPDWNLRLPDLYKHFFLVFSGQVRALPNDMQDRFAYVDDRISAAINLYREIAEAGVALDENSDGSHLYAWRTAMRLFARS
jgi:hypothetical protein